MYAVAIQYKAILEARERYKAFTSDNKLRKAYESRMKQIHDITSIRAERQRTGTGRMPE